MVACADPCASGGPIKSEYPAHAGTSALTMTSVNGSVVNLVSDNDVKLTFDLSTRQFGVP